MKRIVRIGDNETLLDLKQHTLSIEEIENGVYSVLDGTTSYEVRISPQRDEWQVTLGATEFIIDVEDPREARPRRRGRGTEGRCEILSPMPGKIVRLLAAEGDTVEEGAGLVVVEAMKMQNELKASKSGKVVALLARTGASVTAGEVLVILE